MRTEHEYIDYTIIPKHNVSHSNKCTVEILEHYNPYNDQYTYEDCVEYNDGVQKIITKLVKADSED